MPRPKEFNETEVLDRAIVVFWKKGYHNTSITDLTGYLGISKASLYHTYVDKRTLFDSAIERYKALNIENIKKLFECHTSVKKGLSELFDIAIKQNTDSKEENGCFVVNTTTELLPDDDEIKKVLSENKVQMEKLFYDYLEKGVQNGEINQAFDIKSFSSLLFTQYNGLKVISKIDHHKLELLTSTKLLFQLLDKKS